MQPSKPQQGFTLIEIAIVLVIIGLLLGGILKGQELITSARVRNLVQQQDGVKAAFFGFQDRFRSLPGDYSGAMANIQGATTNGNGDGQIKSTSSTTSSTAGSTTTTVNEPYLVWEHLSKSGFINGNYVYGTSNLDNVIPKNPFGQYIGVAYDNVYAVPTAATAIDRHNLKTGNQIPVEILAEVDRKIDDGNGTTGSFVFSTFTEGAAGTGPSAPGAAPACMATDGKWNLTGSTKATNCGAATLL